jgi:hypothetical protein
MFKGKKNKNKKTKKTKNLHTSHAMQEGCVTNDVHGKKRV